jgi:hypothetical protein
VEADHEAVFAAEKTMVQELAQMASSGSSASSQTEHKTPEATISGRLLTKETMVAAGGKQKVAVEGSSAAATVPAAVLEAAGEDVVVLVASFKRTTSGGAFQAPPEGASLAAPPVSVRMVSSRSSENAAGTDDLAEPILVTVLSQRLESAFCAYWNTAEERWSGEGLTSIDGPNGELVCETNHLTVFAAIIGEFERLSNPACLNVEVLTEKGLGRLRGWGWWYRPAALLVWAIILIQALVLAIALGLDWRAWKDGRWHDDDFFTSNPAYREDGETRMARLQKQARGMFRLASSEEPITVKTALPKLKQLGDRPTTATESPAPPAALRNIEAAPTADLNLLRPQAEADARRRAEATAEDAANRPESPNKAEKVAVKVAYGCLLQTLAREQRISSRDLRDLIRGVANVPQVPVRSKATSLCAEKGVSGAGGCSVSTFGGGGGSTPLSSKGVSSPKSISSSPSNRHRAGSSAGGKRGGALIKRVSLAANPLFERAFGPRVFSKQVACLFMSLQPWVALGHFSITVSAFIRALLLTAKLTGALMLSALCFDATGDAMSIDSPPSCESKGVISLIVRNLAIGVASVLLAAIPLLGVGQLQSRRFVYMEYGDAMARRRYLRCWRLEDAVVVILTVTYSLCCILYVAAFLANLGPKSEATFVGSVVGVLLLELLFAPLALSFLYAAVSAAIANWKPGLCARVQNESGLFRGKAGTPALTNGEESTDANGPPKQAPRAAVHAVVVVPQTVDLLGRLAEEDVTLSRISREFGACRLMTAVQEEEERQARQKELVNKYSSGDRADLGNLRTAGGAGSSALGSSGTSPTRKDHSPAKSSPFRKRAGSWAEDRFLGSWAKGSCAVNQDDAGEAGPIDKYFSAGAAMGPLRGLAAQSDAVRALSEKYSGIVEIADLDQDASPSIRRAQVPKEAVQQKLGLLKKRLEQKRRPYGQTPMSTKSDRSCLEDLPLEMGGFNLNGRINLGGLQGFLSPTAAGTSGESPLSTFGQAPAEPLQAKGPAEQALVDQHVGARADLAPPVGVDTPLNTPPVDKPLVNTPPVAKDSSPRLQQQFLRAALFGSKAAQEDGSPSPAKKKARHVTIQEWVEV